MSDGATDQRRLPSAGLLLAALERHREEQHTHFESLDTKAGVAIGFAGAVVAIAKDVQPVLARVGVGFAVIAAVLAMFAFRPRKHPVLDPRGLRRYLRAEEGFTQLRLLDTEIEMALRASQLIEVKARWLQLSLLALVVAVALLGAGTLVR